MFVDHFSNGSVDLPNFPSSGTITEPAGTQLRLYIPDGLEANITQQATGAMVAYRAPGIFAGGKINGPFSFDVKLDKFTNTASNLCLAGIMAWNGRIEDLWSTARCYYLAYYANESQLIVDGFVNSWSSPGRLASSGGRTKPDDGSNKHIYRILINPLNTYVRLTDLGFGAGANSYINANSIGFAYSTDAGATWTWWYQRTLDFEITQIGPMMRNWTPAAGQSHEALFDYFAITSYDWDARTKLFVPDPYAGYDHDADDPWSAGPKTRTSLEDEGSPISAGGPLDHNFPIGRGFWAPGTQSAGVEPGRQQKSAVEGLEDEYRYWMVINQMPVLPGSLQQSDYGGESASRAAVSTEDALEFTWDQGERYYSALDVPSGYLMPGDIGRQIAGAEDQLFYELAEADYQNDKYDTDGRELLYNTGSFRALVIQTGIGGFGNPTANNHWGASRDGKLYADGIECATQGLGFGTLSGGKRRTAWRFTDHNQLMQREPYYNSTPAWYTEVLSADGELELTHDSPPGNWIPDITSHGKWYLDGDFDVEIEFDEFTGTQEQNRFEFGVGNSRGGNPNSTMVYIYVRRNTSYAYVANRQINGSHATLGTIAMTVPSAGKLRITRVSDVYQCYKWDAGDTGWVAVGTPFSDPALEGPNYVWMGLWNYSGYDSHIKIRNFTRNAGTVINTVSWYRETPNDHRGLTPEMPTTLVAVATDYSLDLIDLDTDKLWMRFVRGSNYAFIDNGGNSVIRDIAWDDGVLLLAVGRDTAEGQEGNVIVIDFTMDYIRYHREAASTVCGAFFQHWIYHEPGHIANRNIGYGWSNDNDTWHIKDYRTRSVTLFHLGGYQYRAVGTVEGVSVFRWLRWNMNGEESGVNDDDWGMVRSESTEATEMQFVRFQDEILFYVDDTTLYSRDRTNGGSSGWEDTIGATFTAQYTKALPGTRLFRNQYEPVFHDTGSLFVFMAANEGVYRVEWPLGSWELYYGKVGSGATHEILPDYDRVTHISKGNDGTSDLLLIGTETGNSSQIVLVNLATNAVYGVTLPSTPTRASRLVTS